MKTKQQILDKIKELDEKRLKSIKERDEFNIESTSAAVASNLVLIYAFQQQILEWALENENHTRY